MDQSVATSDAETSVSTDTANGSGTPTGSVVPGRDRSGTLMGRSVWDDRRVRAEPHPHHLNPRHQAFTTSRSGPFELIMPTSSLFPTPFYQLGTQDPRETEDDADLDGDMDMDLSLKQNIDDDLAMGAPPDAPRAIDAPPRTRNRGLTVAMGGRTTATGKEELAHCTVLVFLRPTHIPPLPIPVSIPFLYTLHTIVFRSEPLNVSYCAFITLPRSHLACRFPHTT